MEDVDGGAREEKIGVSIGIEILVAAVEECWERRQCAFGARMNLKIGVGADLVHQGWPEGAVFSVQMSVTYY